MSLFPDDKNKTHYCILIICLGIVLMMFINSRLSKNNKEKMTDTNTSHEIRMYYAEWCGHSRAMLPAWNDFENDVTNTRSDLNAVKVNCEETDICSNYPIPGYPTVILHKNDGSMKMYVGDRSREDLMRFVVQELSV